MGRVLTPKPEPGECRRSPTGQHEYVVGQLDCVYCHGLPDLQAMLDLTDHQYRILLSAHQNGHFAIIESEKRHCEQLLADGLLEMMGEITARITAKMDELLNERERRYRAGRE